MFSYFVFLFSPHSFVYNLPLFFPRFLRSRTCALRLTAVFIKDKMKLRSYGRDWKYRILSENWESKIHFKQMNSDTKFVPRDHPEGHIYQEKKIPKLHEASGS